MLLRSSRAAAAVSKEASLGSVAGSAFKGLKSLGKGVGGYAKRVGEDVSSLSKHMKSTGITGPLPKGQTRGIAGWKPSTAVGTIAKHPMKALGIAGGAAMAGDAALTAGKGVIQGAKTPTSLALMKRRMQGFGG